MDTLGKESFGLSISAASDAEFDALVRYLENIIVDVEFQFLLRNFTDKYYQEFDDAKKSKLVVTPIFKESISSVEKFTEEQLLERIPRLHAAAVTTWQHHEDEVAVGVFDMLLKFRDFLAFKEMFLDYKTGKEGRGLDLGSGLVVTSLCKSSSTPASRSKLWRAGLDVTEWAERGFG